MSPTTSPFPLNSATISCPPSIGRSSNCHFHCLQPHRCTSSIRVGYMACTFRKARPTTAPTRTLFIHEVKIDDSSAASLPADETKHIAPPKTVRAKGYDRHVDVSWEAVTDDNLQGYVIYRSLSHRRFRPIGIQAAGINRYVDFIGRSDQQASYMVRSVDRSYHESGFSNKANAATRQLSDDELLTMLQEACFRYYWEGSDPVTGAPLENIPGNDRIVATGASGFGIMGMIVGIDRGFITREQGLRRLTAI